VCRVMFGSDLPRAPTTRALGLLGGTPLIGRIIVIPLSEDGLSRPPEKASVVPLSISGLRYVENLPDVTA